MLKLLLNNQVDQLKELMEEQVLNHIKSGQINKFECHNGLNLISFDWYDIKDNNAAHAGITIYFSGDHLVFLCEGERCLDHVQQLVHEESDSLNERMLYSFFSELIKDDIDHMEELEELITEAEDELLTTSRKTYAGQIITFRKELLRLKRYYEQLNQIFEGLIENENDLISREDLRYFRILNNKVDRLFAHVLNLRDYVTQVREAYQAQIDIEQNKLMKIFTVVTSIFMPLTLIVGWYGMNLKMPEYSWSYAYPVVAVVSLVVVAISILLFKRRKWF